MGNTKKSVLLGLDWPLWGGPAWLEEEPRVLKPLGAVQGPPMSTVHGSSGLCVSCPLWTRRGRRLACLCGAHWVCGDRP